MTRRTCDVLIVGGGTGGTAAALALAGRGLDIVVTEETRWLGGQLTSQAVPPDEHPWIESFGRTRRYATFRELVRAFTKRYRRLTADAIDDPRLNPGEGWVSRLCFEPKIGVKAICAMLELDGFDGTIHYRTVPLRAEVANDQIVAVECRNLSTGAETRFEPKFVLDATETGELLALAQVEHVVGAESRQQTREPHALEGPADPMCIQAFTWCAAVGYDPTGVHVGAAPSGYDRWATFEPPHWSGRLLSLTFPNVRTAAPQTLPVFSEDRFDLFRYRQIIEPRLRARPTDAVTVMNWPQNDYLLGDVIHGDPDLRAQRLREARELTYSVLHWLQTEHGLAGLRLRPDVSGTDDGLAMAPYHREGRRIAALTTVCEQHVSSDALTGRDRAVEFPDSVGLGAYRIDLHPSTNGQPTLDIGSLPFQIPLRALVPVRIRNMLPAAKNIGTTHVTNGCYRLHPVEWNIGEASAWLAMSCLAERVSPQKVAADPNRVRNLQDRLARDGVEMEWPYIGPL